MTPKQLETIDRSELDAVAGGEPDGSRESNLAGAYATRKLVGSGYTGGEYAKNWRSLQESAHRGFAGLNQPFGTWEGFRSRVSGWPFVREASY